MTATSGIATLEICLIEGSILVAPVLRTQLARRLKGSAGEHSDRPELLNSFRKNLAGEVL